MTARLPLVLLAVLALPFVPFWPDYEHARRALMVALACGLAIASLAWRKSPLDLTSAGTTWLLLGLSGLLLIQPWSDPIHAIYLASLYAAFVLGTCTNADTFARAGCWVGTAVAALGTAQALGLTWPAGLVTTATPVATLGNLNVASEVVAMAASGALVLLANARTSGPLAATLVLLASYLWLNGSRSGLLALGLATLVVLGGKGTRKPLLMACVALGLGVGWTLDRFARTLPEEPPASARAAPAGRPEPLAKPSTLTVRKELWLGVLAMTAEAPVLGHGAGTFRAVYPRFRREGELEASTFGRQFLARVESAHNDLLEILAERGILGLLLALGFAVLVFRTGISQGLCASAPLVAFAALAMVRSPLGNAPAAFLAFGYAGGLCRAARRTQGSSQTLLLVRVVIGLVLGSVAWVAACALYAETKGAEYLKESTTTPLQDRNPNPLARAAYLMPSDTRWMRLRLQLEAARRSPAWAWENLEDLHTDLAQRDPWNPETWMLIAELAHAAAKPAEALLALGKVKELDPRHPDAALLRSVLCVEHGDATGALQALTTASHPRLRAGLPQHLVDLADLADRRNDHSVAVRLRAEQAFVVALDQALAAADDRARLAALRAVDVLRDDVFPAAGLAETDARPTVLRAALQLARGQDQLARDLGDQAKRKGLTVPLEVRDLVAPLARPLLAMKEWQPILAW